MQSIIRSILKSTFNKMAIALIIDDEIDICYLLSGILKRKNLEPNYVNSLSDAVVSLEQDKPTVVFLDNHLPDGRGMDFIKYIKLNYPKTKIIMITAYDTTEDRNQAIGLGVDGFIGKPFSMDMIFKTVDQLLS